MREPSSAMKMISSLLFTISSQLLVFVLSHSTTNHYGNRSTNHLEGIQEELQQLKRTVQSLVTLTHVINNKVDTNTNNIQTLTNNMIAHSKKVDSIAIKVDLTASRLDTTAIKVDTIATRLDSTSSKVYTTATKVDLTASKLDTTTRKVDTIATRLDSISLKVDTTVNKVDLTASRLDTLTEKADTIATRLDSMSSKMDKTVDKVDLTASKLDTTTGKVYTIATRLDSMSSKVYTTAAKVDLTASKLDTTTAKVDTIATRLNWTSSKVDTISTKVSLMAPKVDLNAKIANFNSKSLTILNDEISPIIEQCRALPSEICGSCKCRDDKRLPKKYYCDCTHLPAKRDCKQFHQEGFMMDGVYKIHQNSIHVIQIFCDQTTDGGGWSVFQRRSDGSVKFYRDWLSYKVGFGNLHHEFWLGNANLFTLSLQGIYPSGNELRIELTDWNGVQKIAKYGSFELSNENLKFQLNVGEYSGSAGDSLSYHNRMNFTTFDQDNDNWYGNCAVRVHGAWWYNGCHTSNLNGVYYDFGFWESEKGTIWYTFRGHEYSMKHVEMKVRRKG